MDIQKNIRAHALQNAARFGGKADPGAVLGKILGENPDLRKNADEAKQLVLQVVLEVNALSTDEQAAELASLHLPEAKKKEKREGLKDLPYVHGNVVMRIAPSPSGPLHIGHAYIIGLNYEYAKKYGGEFILRIEDTNADNIYEPAYDMIPDDTRWLTENGVSKVIIQSDRMDLYYRYAEKLLASGHSYICTCPNEEFKEKLGSGIACPCRELPPEEQLSRWKKMFSGFKEGEAVVRFKSDIFDKNPAMRDFPLLRINDTEHPRQGKKYRVWPLMNFAVSIDDMDTNVTHALRGKDHADNAKRQAMIHAALGVPTPVPISVGRINFEGFEVSASRTKEKIKQGIYTGWDDIRIPFIPALRRRGYMPEAFRRYAVGVGVTQNDKTVSLEDFFKTINAFNKDIIDAKTFRYFFVWDAEKVEIKGAVPRTVELDLHPDNRQGGRVFQTKTLFYLSREDAAQFKEGGFYRLMDCLNFKKEGAHLVFVSTSYEDYKEKGNGIFHWLPVCNELVPVEVIMGDASVVKGFGEPALQDVQIGQTVQFERFGFCRFDARDGNTLKFWWLHK